MKTISILILVFFSSCMTYTMVSAPKSFKQLQVEGSKDELYVRANIWMARTFTNSKSVIQFQDKENGVIVGKYLMLSADPNDIYSMVTIYVKDKTTKIEIEPMGEWQYWNGNGGFSTDDCKILMAGLILKYESFIKSDDQIWNK